MKRKKLFKALVSGKLPIANIELNCAVLNDEANTRIIGAASVFKAFDREARSNARLPNIPAFMDAQNLQLYISNELKRLINPIEYLDGDKISKGFDSSILAELCDMYLNARRANTLVPKQLHLAEKAENITICFC